MAEVQIIVVESDAEETIYIENNDEEATDIENNDGSNDGSNDGKNKSGKACNLQKIQNIHIDTLLDLNKKTLHNKLATVNTRKLKSGRIAYRANDIIEILSSNKERDKRLINDYETKEIIVIKSKCGKYTRNTRFFTPAGISRYLLEGKIFAYENACKFFNITPKNMEHVRWQKQLTDMKVDDLYSTKPLLKWLFDKRKACKLLGETCTITDVLGLFTTDAAVNQKKIEYLKGLL